MDNIEKQPSEKPHIKFESTEENSQYEIKVIKEYKSILLQNLMVVEKHIYCKL